MNIEQKILALSTDKSFIKQHVHPNEPFRFEIQSTDPKESWSPTHIYTLSLNTLVEILEDNKDKLYYSSNRTITKSSEE